MTLYRRRSDVGLTSMRRDGGLTSFQCYVPAGIPAGAQGWNKTEWTFYKCHGVESVFNEHMTWNKYWFYIDSTSRRWINVALILIQLHMPSGISRFGKACWLTNRRLSSSNIGLRCLGIMSCWGLNLWFVYSCQSFITLYIFISVGKIPRT